MVLTMNSLPTIAVAFATFFVTFCNADQPSYQVSLFVNLHPKGSPVHLCNGAIIQNRLIITTASCVHYRFGARSLFFLIPPQMLQVVSGSNTAFTSELTTDVEEILVADKFNSTTGDNDLALLRLTDKLPLGSRSDMSWITLEDADYFEGPCLGNFYVRNALSTGPNYIQSEELPLLESENCRENSDFPHARENDICSLYMLPLDFNCRDIKTLMPYNNDRGTGLVCENKLIGLLSTVLATDDNNDDELNCADKPIRAFYSSLGPHLEWIYSIVGDEDLQMYEDGEYLSSLPYSGKNNAMAETEIPEPGLSSPLVGNITPNSTETLLHRDSAASNLISFTSAASNVISNMFLLLALAIWGSRGL